MGDYSEFCSVSGLPINYNDEIVIIPVEKSRFYQTKEKEFYPNWVPKGFPIFGKYDNAGGFNGQPRGPFIILHKTVWDNAEIYWHYMNRKDLSLNYDQIKAEAQNDKKRNDEMAQSQGEDNFWKQYSNHKMTDYIFYFVNNHQINRSCKGINLSKMFDGKNVSRAGAKDDFCFLYRNRFAEIVCEKIEKGITKQDIKILNKMICIWGSPKVTGKTLIPTSIANCPEQYPDDFTQRIAILKKHLSLARKLAKKKT